MISTSRLAVVALSLCAAAYAQETKKLSVGIGGAFANGNNLSPAISNDGRYVAFWSIASNLVPHDSNSRSDVFVLDRQSALMRCASLTSSNQASDGDSFALSISGDGRYVAFESLASNLIGAGSDANGFLDIYLRDMVTGQTTIVSRPPGFVESNGNSRTPAISSDGRYIAFESNATNLVPGDNNAALDVFVFDRVLLTMSIESVDDIGTPGDGDSMVPSISSDGRYVAFTSFAQNFGAPPNSASLNVFVRDRVLHTTRLVSHTASGIAANGACTDVRISADGNVISFASIANNLVFGDTNGAPDVFVWRRVQGYVTRESVAEDGSEISEGEVPYISGDGRYITFATTDSHAIVGDTNAQEDVIERDLELGINWLASQSSAGAQGNNTSYEGMPNFDGSEVVFVSGASNFDGPTFAKYQVFCRGFHPPVQENLGHRHGASMLVVSGADLSSGTVASLDLIHAPKLRPGFVCIGLSNHPTFIPALGGELVTLPLAVLLPMTTDADGRLSLSLPGGAGPASFTLQCVTLGSVAAGYRVDLSNAVMAVVLP